MSTPAVTKTVLRIVGGATVAALTLAGGWSVATELASTTRTERLTLDADDVTSVLATTDVGDITVEAGGAGTDVEVEARLHGSWKAPDLEQRLNGGRLVLNGLCPQGFLPNCSIDLVLRVPQGTPLTGRSSVGDVTAVGRLGDVDLETSTGDVSTRRLETSRLRVATSVGDVRLTLAAPADVVEVTSSVGDVRVVVPDDGTRYAVDVRTDVGDQRTTVPQSPTAAHTIRVTSSVGDVRVVPQGADHPGG